MVWVSFKKSSSLVYRVKYHKRNQQTTTDMWPTCSELVESKPKPMEDKRENLIL